MHHCTAAPVINAVGGSCLVDHTGRQAGPLQLRMPKSPCHCHPQAALAVPAAAALPHMAGVLNSRPAQFSSPGEAVQWALRTGMSRNKQAAALSIPLQLRQQQQGGGYQWITPLQQSSQFWQGWYSGMSEAFLKVAAPKVLMLAGECGAAAWGAACMRVGVHGAAVGVDASRQVRRHRCTRHAARSQSLAGLLPVRGTALGAWLMLQGAGSSAVTCAPRPAAAACPRAGSDRLDTVLTIGQMQGKFQLVLLPAAGHAVHEDEADKAAEHMVQFLKRFRVGEPPLQFPKASGVRPVLPVVAGPTMPSSSGPGA